MVCSLHCLSKGNFIYPFVRAQLQAIHVQVLRFHFLSLNPEFASEKQNPHHFLITQKMMCCFHKKSVHSDKENKR